MESKPDDAGDAAGEDMGTMSAEVLSHSKVACGKARACSQL